MYPKFVCAILSVVFVSKCMLIGNYFIFTLLHISYAFNVLCFGLVAMIKIIILKKSYMSYTIDYFIIQKQDWPAIWSGNIIFLLKIHRFYIN